MHSLAEPGFFLRLNIVNDAEVLAHKLHALVVDMSHNGLAQKLQKILHVKVVYREDKLLQLLVAHRLQELRVQFLGVLVRSKSNVTEDEVVATVVKNDPIEFAAVDFIKGNGGSGGVTVDEGLHCLHLLRDRSLHLENFCRLQP